MSVSHLLSRARVILLDFDGPVCGLFARHPAPAIATELRRILAGQGVTLADEPDPLEVLRHTARLGRDAADPLTRRIERALTAAEITAAHSAEPTPHAHEFVRAAHRAGNPLAIVSNNSADACRAYLSHHRLDRYIDTVIGRPFADPARMKPHPGPVLAALATLNAPPGECVLIGDSRSDIEAAHAAGVRAIGYANRPGKAARLATADAMVDTMADLLTGITGK